VLNFFWVRSRNVQIHVLVTLATRAMLHESRATSLDLHAATRFLLDMLDIRTSVANNLSSKIETWNWFEVNWDLLLWPFALQYLSAIIPSNAHHTYSTKLIALNCFWFSPSEASLIDEVRQFLLHELLDLLDSLLETGFARARNVQVQRWVLRIISSHPTNTILRTYRRCGHAFIRIILSACCDIFAQVNKSIYTSVSFGFCVPAPVSSLIYITQRRSAEATEVYVSTIALPVSLIVPTHKRE